MKNLSARAVGAASLAAALVIGCALLGANPTPQAPPAADEKGKMAPPPPFTGRPDAYGEYLVMCHFCETAADAGCYEYQDPDGGRVALLGGGCTYPPCPPDLIAFEAYDAAVAELKLACASCRAMCPGTIGRPEKYRAAESAPSPKK